jgi:hypothetical protein
MISSSRRRRLAFALPSISALALLAGTQVAPTSATAASSFDDQICPPWTVALGYSDNLNKQVPGGVPVGGLSDLAIDPISGLYATTMDRHGYDPARVWLFASASSPQLLFTIVLKHSDGTPYTGVDSDNEGFAFLPDGNFLVASEVGPSIRVFGRDGIQLGELPMPTNFRVAPYGAATANATLEGVTVSADGTRVVAAMEEPLSTDISSTDTDEHRFLVFDRDAVGKYQLTRQLGYRTDPGLRVSDVSLYGAGAGLGLVILENGYTAGSGDTIRLYSVPTLEPDVSAIPDLALDPAADLAPKQLIGDLGGCPTLGATSPQAVGNPLMDNYEGLSVSAGLMADGHYLAWISLISDDNFNPLQVTRVLNLAAVLP